MKMKTKTKILIHKISNKINKMENIRQPKK